MVSPLVETVNDFEPLVGTVTVRAPVVIPKLPAAVISTFAVSAVCGVGEAVIVKLAAEPSVTLPSEAMLSSGTSLSETASVAEPAVVDTA